MENPGKKKGNNKKKRFVSNCHKRNVHINYPIGRFSWQL